MSVTLAQEDVGIVVGKLLWPEPHPGSSRAPRDPAPAMAPILSSSRRVIWLESNVSFITLFLVGCKTRLNSAIGSDLQDYRLPEAAGVGVPGIPRGTAARKSVTGWAGGAWCMVTIRASAGRLPLQI